MMGRLKFARDHILIPLKPHPAEIVCDYMPAGYRAELVGDKIFCSLDGDIAVLHPQFS